MQVVVRFRPLHVAENGGNAGCADATTVLANSQSYSFHRAHSHTDSTADVYEANFEPLVRAWLAGSNATIFAFGQTGEGVAVAAAEFSFWLLCNQIETEHLPQVLAKHTHYWVHKPKESSQTIPGPILLQASFPAH